MEENRAAEAYQKRLPDLRADSGDSLAHAHAFPMASLQARPQDASALVAFQILPKESALSGMLRCLLDTAALGKKNRHAPGTPSRITLI
jgi:hypothetical protein